MTDDAVGVGHPRATVRLGLDCNNECVFCAQDGLVPPAATSFEADLTAARGRAEEVTFVGGEPSLDDALIEKLTLARAAGFRRIGLQTNGRRLADLAYTTSLVRAGLTDVHLSLHGGDAAAHDYHTNRPGSFDELLAGIQAARTNALPIVVTTVLTRSNFRVLGDIPPLLAARGVRAWFVSVPVLAGRAATLRDRVAPRLGLALPFALHALAAAHALRLPGFVVGAPLCLLGPVRRARDRWGRLEPTRRCATACPARPACPGVDAEYLARFEGDELSARDAPMSHVTPTALTAMFVGPGELAQVVAPAAPVASRPRTALPMLGKVKPALAEVSSKTERRTGNDLKEIFPTLFEPVAVDGPAAEDDSKP